MRFTLRLFTALSGATIVAGGALAQGDSDVKIGAGLEVNYTYNFNRPANGNNTFLFNNRDGAIRLNLGEVHLSREANMDNRVGFRLSFIDGEVARFLLRNDANVNNPNGKFNASNPNVLEAYGSTQVRENHLVQFGQFLSHVGYETPKVGNGQFFSRSFQMQFMQPVFGAGVRSTWAQGEDASLTLVAQNRFRGVEESGNNRDLAWGFQYKKKAGEGRTWALNGLTTRENLGGNNNKQRGILNFVYTNKVSEKTSFAADLSWLSGKEASGRNFNVSGFTGYLTHQLEEGKILGLRGELLNQSTATAAILPIGANSVRKPTLSSITASLELKNGILPGVRTLIEYRLDRASDPVFVSRSGGKKTQNTLTVGQTYRF